MPTRFAYDVIIGLRATPGENNTTYTTTVISDEKLSADEVIHKAKEIVEELKSNGEFQHYDDVRALGITILGAYDREL